jgi:hypothetical protein
MTLTIELTDEQEATLQAEASAAGLDTTAYALQRIVGGKPRVLRGYGKYAHLPISADQVDREGREDRERENAESDSATRENREFGS